MKPNSHVSPILGGHTRLDGPIDIERSRAIDSAKPSGGRRFHPGFISGSKREAIVRGNLPPSDGVRGAPVVPLRDPPIRFRKNVPDCWIGLELVEGKNRQVRRMTAAIGHPTLRLLRVRIGHLLLGSLQAGRWLELGLSQRMQALA